MSKKRRRRKSKSRSFSKSKKRTGLRTFIETVMGVAIGLLILAFVGWWYFIREAPEPISVEQVNSSVMKNNVVDSTENFEAIRDNGTLDEQKHLLSLLDNWPRDATTPVRIETLSRRLEIAQTILKRDEISEPDRVATAKIALNAMGQIYGIGLVEKIDSAGEIYQQYVDVCNSFVSDSDASVQKEAKLSLAKATVYELTIDSQIRDLPSIKHSINSLITSYPDDQLVASTVELMTKRIQTIDAKVGFEVMNDVVSAYGPEPAKEIKVITRKMRDEILLANSGISEVAKDSIQTKQYDAYIEKLGELANHTDTGVEVVNRIYRAVSYFETAGKSDLAIKVLNKIQEKAAERTDPIARIQALRICKFGLIRNNQVGKRIDLSDTTADGQPLATEKFQDVPALIVFYSPNDPVNTRLFQDLRELHHLVQASGVRFITISVDESRQGNLDLGFNPAWDNIASSQKNTSEIFKRCPVSHVPYFALVDRQGELNAINVPLTTLKTRIEALVSKPVTVNSDPQLSPESSETDSRP